MDKTSKKGFATELALAGILMSGVFVSLYTGAFRSMVRSHATIQSQIEFDTLKQSIQMLLQNSALCSRSLRNSDGTAVHFPTAGSFEIQSGGIRLAYEGKNLGQQMTISQLRFQILEGPIAMPGQTSFYSAVLYLELQKGSGGYGGPSHSTAANPFLLTIMTNARNEIESCGLTERGTASVVSQTPTIEVGNLGGGSNESEHDFGGNWKAIEFKTRVGITQSQGLSTPILYFCSYQRLDNGKIKTAVSALDGGTWAQYQVQGSTEIDVGGSYIPICGPGLFVKKVGSSYSFKGTASWIGYW